MPRGFQSGSVAAPIKAKRYYPLVDRAVVEPIPNDTMTESGLHIPESATGLADHARVVSVGPGTRYTEDGETRFHPMDIKPGDRIVLSNRYAGTQFNHEGTEYYVVERSEIIGVVDEDA